MPRTGNESGLQQFTEELLCQRLCDSLIVDDFGFGVVQGISRRRRDDVEADDPTASKYIVLSMEEALQQAECKWPRQYENDHQLKRT